MYVITDDYTSFRGQPVKDVATPVDDNDAATKGYVDSRLSSMETLTLGHTTINETQL